MHIGFVIHGSGPCENKGEGEVEEDGEKEPPCVAK